MYILPTKETVYHIFTNGSDEWLTEKEGAFKVFKDWKKEFGTARLYSTVWDKVEGTYEDEDCLESYGSFPS